MNRNWTQGILSFTVVGIVIGMLALGGSGALVAQAADPIKIGFGIALTGGLSANGKPALLAMQIWKDEIKPLKEIGKYGGTWRAGFTGPADYWNGFRCCSGPDHLMFWDYTGDKVLPNKI